MTASDREAKPSVVIVGGGIAGLEAALALADLGGDRAQRIWPATGRSCHWSRPTRISSTSRS